MREASLSSRANAGSHGESLFIFAFHTVKRFSVAAGQTREADETRTRRVRPLEETRNLSQTQDTRWGVLTMKTMKKERKHPRLRNQRWNNVRKRYKMGWLTEITLDKRALAKDEPRMDERGGKRWRTQREEDASVSVARVIITDFPDLILRTVTRHNSLTQIAHERM